MNKTFSIYQILPYIAIVVLLLMQFGNTSFFGETPEDEVKTDSTKVTHVIPEKSGSFDAKNIQPIIIYPPSVNSKDNSNETNALLSLIKNLESNQSEMKALLEVIAKKEYQNKYSDSIIDLEVNDVVENGKLISQKANWKIKESYIDYFEKTHTYKLKPKFTISGGLGIDAGLNETPQLKAVLGFKNAKGYELEGSFSINNRYGISLKKDIFNKYK